MIRNLLSLCLILVCAGCGDTMNRGIVITGDGKVGANNARNERDNTQERLRNAIQEDLGEKWTVLVAIEELPVWVEGRQHDDGDWRWERLTAKVRISPPAGAALSEAKRSEFEVAAQTYLGDKLAKRDPARLSIALVVDETAVAVTPPHAVPAGDRTYLVQPGDTLADISTAFYGSPQHWRLIAQANPGGTQAGQNIIIPVQPAAPAPSAP